MDATKAMNLLDVLDAEQYVMLKNEGLTNIGTPPNGTTRGFYLQNGPDGKPINTDWYDYIYQTGFSHSHTLNISGANERTSYYFSFGYTDQEGMLKKNTFKRLGGRMNLDHKVSDRITVGGNFTYSNSINFSAKFRLVIRAGIQYFRTWSFATCFGSKCGSL